MDQKVYEAETLDIAQEKSGQFCPTQVETNHADNMSITNVKTYVLHMSNLKKKLKRPP